MNRWHLVTLSLLIFGIPWIWLNRVPMEVYRNFETPQPAVNHPAPNFRLTTFDGEQFMLNEQLGTPIVLNFWATWCGPCRNELPTLQLASERFQGRVQIVGIDQGERSEDVARFVEEFGLTFTIPMDPTLEVGSLYAVRAMPTTFFIDRNGIIRYLWIGEMNSVTLTEGIAEILR